MFLLSLAWPLSHRHTRRNWLRRVQQTVNFSKDVTKPFNDAASFVPLLLSHTTRLLRNLVRVTRHFQYYTGFAKETSKRFVTTMIEIGMKTKTPRSQTGTKGVLRDTILVTVVDLVRLELTTSSMPLKRSPN
jgi:hypothetical protein